jgi:ABC-type Fe3+-hydroxamate transport system substrate-binding protein
MFRKTKVLWIVLVMTMIVSACGSATTASSPQGEEPTSAPVREAATEAASQTNDEERLVRHTFGETLIKGTPTRVVVLEWTYVEDVLAVGLQPVGVADIDGYNEWVKIPVELSTDAVDVGLRGEPNLETIASLNPDLIIDTQYRAAEYYDKLSVIAPTLIFEPYPTDETINQYDEMTSTFTTIANVLGKQTEAEKVLAHLDQKYVDAQKKIEEAGLLGEKFVLSQMFSWENAVYVRLFTKNGMASQIVERIGLENGWDDGFQAYGFSEVSVEKLPELGDLHYFYVVNADDQVMNLDTVSPIWQSLPFVKSGQAYPLGGDTWLFGGPLSAELIVDIVVGELVK